MASGCARGGSDWILGNIYSLSSIGAGIFSWEVVEELGEHKDIVSETKELFQAGSCGGCFF